MVATSVRVAGVWCMRVCAYAWSDWEKVLAGVAPPGIKIGWWLQNIEGRRRLHVQGTLERIDPGRDTLRKNLQFIFRTIYITSLFGNYFHLLCILAAVIVSSRVRRHGSDDLVAIQFVKGAYLRLHFYHSKLTESADHSIAGNINVEKSCHPPSSKPAICPRSPSKIDHCPCGRNTIVPHTIFRRVAVHISCTPRLLGPYIHLRLRLLRATPCIFAPV